MYIVLFFAVFCLAGASDVLVYTDSDFVDNVAEHDIILVEFYAPWCGHCKKLAPEYEKAATVLKDNDPPVPLAKVDCTVETKTCEKHGVSGYPTLKIFRGGEFSEDYNGPRDSDGIVRTLRTKAGPTSKELTSLEDAKKFVEKEEYGIVGFFETADSETQKQFMKLADSLGESYRFAHTLSKDILNHYKYKDNIVIFQPKRLQSKFEPKEVKYEGDVNVGKLKTFVKESVQGLAGLRTLASAEQFERKPLVIVFYDIDFVKNAKGTSYWRNRVLKVAQKLQNEGKKVYFAVSDTDDFRTELDQFGLTFDGDSPLVAAYDSRDQKFVSSEKFSMDSLEKFANDLLGGKLEPYLKSEPIPEDGDEAVKTVVAKNFEAVVNDNTKDVLIEFYAPWCGHCKSLAPKYEELAQKLKDEDEIVIAKMDATANDVPKPYEVQGFPTIYYSPAGSKSSPRKYQGGREVKDFVTYLAKESTNPLKKYTREGKKKKPAKTDL